MSHIASEDDKKRNERMHEFLMRFKASGTLLFRLHPEEPMQDGDIYAGGFPKSGSTWLSTISHQIRVKGADMAFDCFQRDAMPLYSALITSEELRSAPMNVEPRMFQHHLKYDLTKESQSNANIKYVVVLRDPLDTFVSWYNFVPSLLYADQMNISVEDFYFGFYVDLQKIIGCTNYNYTRDWYQHRNEPNVLVLHFEDLKSDLPAQIERIAQFMGCTLTHDEKLRVVYTCSHKYMLEHKEQFTVNSVRDKLFELGMINQQTIEQQAMWVMRENGGKSGEAKLQLPKTIIEHIESQFEQIMLPAVGCASYQELLMKSRDENTTG